MKYLLAVLTHGENEALVDQACDAFYEMADPEPTEEIIHRDDPPRGFCAASAALWQRCVERDVTYVFWLEHDFILSRPVDMRWLAKILDAYPRLAQMALMRNAYSPEEKAAGGLFELRRDDFDPQPPEAWLPSDWMRMPWFTTNPSLMRRQFMADYPLLDDGEPFCEGRHGIALRDAGFEFGTWGSGEVWCEHVGVRTGFGY